MNNFLKALNVINPQSLSTPVGENTTLGELLYYNDEHIRTKLRGFLLSLAENKDEERMIELLLNDYNITELATALNVSRPTAYSKFYRFISRVKNMFYNSPKGMV